MKLAIAVLVLTLCLGASAITGIPPLTYSEGSVVLEEDFLGGSLTLCWSAGQVTGFFSDYGLIEGTLTDGITITGNVYTAGEDNNDGTFTMNLVVPAAGSERAFVGTITGLQTNDITWTWSSSNPRISSVDADACWSAAFTDPTVGVAGQYENRQDNSDGSYDVISYQYICTEKDDDTKIYGSWYEPGHKYYIEADLVHSFVQADVWRYDILNGNQVKNGAFYAGSGLFFNNGATLSGYVWDNANVTSADDSHHWIELTRYLKSDGQTYPSASSSNCNKLNGLKDDKVSTTGPVADYDFSTPDHKEEDFSTFNHPYTTN